MTKGRWIGIACVCILLLASHTAWAQTTGSIRGRTVDTDGNALPGVTIVVTGDVLGSAQRTSVTSPSGGFMFSAVPVGDFTITASLDGFQTQAAEAVRVALGKVATVDFTMPEAFSDEITVIAETPIIDVASPTFDTRFESDQIIDLPTRGNFYDMIAFTPGVNQISEGGSWFAAYGSDVKSSQWNIDGLDRTAPEGGDLSWSMNDELVEEIQVLGTGATAEYGGMLGTAFNLITKSGTNQFHGSASFDYWNPNWVDENAVREDAPEGAQTFQLDHHNNLALALGGPIVKDSLWFYAGVEFGRYQAFWPFQDPDLPGQKESSWDNYNLKLTSQLAQSHRLTATLASQEYLGPSAGDVNYEPSAWSENWNLHRMVALDYSAILGPNTVLEARGGVWRGDNEYRSQYPSGEPALTDYLVYPYQWYGDVWWTWDWEQHSDNAEVIFTQHAEEFIKGDHEFRFGVQYNRGGGTTKTFNPDWYYYYDYYGGYPYVYWYTGLPYYYGGESESVGAFVTDSWTISSKLTLDIGVRWDRHEGWIDDFNRLDMDSNPTGEVIPGRDMVDWSHFDPRFGFAWQPSGDGRTVVRGSIGLFHAGMTSGDWYSPPPETPTWSYYYQPFYGYGEPWDPDGWILWNTWEATDTAIVDGTENAYAWEYTLGFEHQLTATSAIGIQAVYKETKDQIGWYIVDDGVYTEFEWSDPETGTEYTFREYSEFPTRLKGNSTGPGAYGGDRPYEQEYLGFFLTYKKRFSNNWDLMASYSYSDSEGLNPRYFTTSWSGQGQVLYANRSEADPNAFVNSYKTLGGDRRHVLRIVGNVVLPLDFRLNSVINIQSGRVYDRFLRVPVPSTAGTFDVISQPASDDQRFPTQYLWDLGFGKNFNLGKGTDFSIFIQILNLLNDDAVVSWRDSTWPVGQEPLPGSWVLPRRAELRLRVAF